MQQLLAGRGMGTLATRALEWCDSQGLDSMAELCEAEEEDRSCSGLMLLLDVKPGKAKLLMKDMRAMAMSRLIPSQTPPRFATAAAAAAAAACAASPLVPSREAGKATALDASRSPLSALPQQPSLRLAVLTQLYQTGRDAAEAGLLPSPPFPIQTRSDEFPAGEEQRTPEAVLTVASNTATAKTCKDSGLTTPAAGPKLTGTRRASWRASFGSGAPSRELCTPIARLSSSTRPSSAPGALTGGWTAEESDSMSSPESVASEPPPSSARPRCGIVSRLPLVTSACKHGASPASPPASGPDRGRLDNEPGEEVDWETGTPVQEEPASDTPSGRGAACSVQQSPVAKAKAREGGNFVSPASTIELAPTPHSTPRSPSLPPPSFGSPLVGAPSFGPAAQSVPPAARSPSLSLATEDTPRPASPVGRRHAGAAGVDGPGATPDSGAIALCGDSRNADGAPGGGERASPSTKGGQGVAGDSNWQELSCRLLSELASGRSGGSPAKPGPSSEAGSARTHDKAPREVVVSPPRMEEACGSIS